MLARPRVVAVIGLLLGVLIFTTATGVVRNLLGDVLVVVVLVAVLASVPVGRSWMRIVGVGIGSLGVEAFQGLGWITAQSHWLAHATVGSTYDPQDFVAYAVGLGVACGAERWWADHSNCDSNCGGAARGRIALGSSDP